MMISRVCDEAKGSELGEKKNTKKENKKRKIGAWRPLERAYRGDKK